MRGSGLWLGWERAPPARGALLHHLVVLIAGAVGEAGVLHYPFSRHVAASVAGRCTSICGRPILEIGLEVVILCHKRCLLRS